MTFRVKIFAALATVGVLPVVLLGWLSFSVHRSELQRTVGRAQASIAEEAARSCERFVAGAVESLRLSVSALPLDQLTPQETFDVLRIPYRQLDFADVLVELESDGRQVTAPVYETSAPGKTVQFEPDDAALFFAHVPALLALQSGMAIGAPYAGRSGPLRLPVAIRLPGARVLAAELSLAALQKRVDEISRDGTVAFVATSRGAPLAHTEPSAVLTEDERSVAATPGSRLVQRADGQPWLASSAPVGGLGWSVVVLQRESEAFRAADQVRRYTIFWACVALLLTLVVGGLLSRRVTRPIDELRAGVRALEQHASAAVTVDSNDEFGELATAFNSMAAEIRRWNAELQARVDARTAELKAAQDQILRTRRLAALGSLGAGVAHELNNPLTAVSGFLALLRKDLAGSPSEELVRVAQEQTRRVSRIVSDLRVFAEQERSTVGRRFELAPPVQAAIDLYDEQIKARHIRVSTDLMPGVREAQGDPAQIQQVVAHLVQNAIYAMPDGGDLRVSLSDVSGDALKITVTDTGKGIPPDLRERIFDPFFTTKDQPSGVGLGLAVSHSIVEAHHGRLFVDSAEGHGATFTIVLPAAARAAHLA